jgi:protein-L-isoaspartate O-methyltransferase
MSDHRATYSPEDNKLRLYPAYRLDKEDYTRVRAQGFIWAPKQELFVAPMWTPSREDFLIEMCGDIEDEDKSLVERSEERADRFTDYSAARADDAAAAHKAVSAIADNIPLGQPILVGHHSEKHARKDAEKIRNGMRKAIKMWDQSQYWKDRAHGSIRLAKYKERPDVRARRIKGLEADQRKSQKRTDECTRELAAWQAIAMIQDPAEQYKAALSKANHGGQYISFKFTLEKYPRGPECTSNYEGDQGIWGALDSKIIDGAKAAELLIPVYQRSIASAARWLQHYQNRLDYERTMLDDSGGTVTDRKGPEVGGAIRCWQSPGHGAGWSYIDKVNKVSVSIRGSWGEGRTYKTTMPLDKIKATMTAAEVSQARIDGKLKEVEGNYGFYLLESREQFDAREANEAQPDPPPPITTNTAAAIAADILAMRATVKAGVKVVSAPQLFPTPPELARRMVEEADIQPGHDVLEPSAGTGNIAAIIRETQAHHSATNQKPATLQCVEINYNLAQRLEQFGYNVAQHDFLDFHGTEVGSFDRILMNPPFSNADDIKHIEHAWQMLKPGGRLVAICANGPRQRDKFIPWLEEIGGTWEDLPADTFKQSGTGVNTALIVADKPKPRALEPDNVCPDGPACPDPECQAERAKQIGLF